MHELGIVFYIIKDVKEVAVQNDVKHITAVTMDIGEVSTIVPDYLTDMWEWAIKKEPLLEGARLIINTTPAITHCDNCQLDYPTVKHGKICPYCQSEKTWLKTGNEVEIRNIEVE